MNIIIIEDEQYAFDKLSILLSKLNNNINIVGHGKSISQAVEIIKMNSEIDLAFFDIQLSDGLSFSIFDRIDFSFPVIFTTAYDNHAIRAFKHNSIDYLLKPIRKTDLQLALEKYKTIWRPDKATSNIIAKLQTTNTKVFKEQFIVKIGEHIKIIKSKEIVCFYSLEKITFLLTSDNRNYPLDYSLDQIISLVNIHEFFRISRKYIINLNYIKDIISYTNSRLKLILSIKNDDEIIISREKVKDFKNWINR